MICQFSCGAASAVATKLTLAKYTATHEVLIVNAFIQQEHDDNRRFLAECEQWFGRPITVLRDEKYNASTVEVFRRERFMKGPRGAPCTKILKRRLLSQLERPGDVIVFGFTAEEADRADDFRERNPDRPMIAPLIDAGLGKEDCKAMVLRAGIELPLMYRMGYDNANCIGCVKGGMGYWRTIREDFPEQFEELARVQEEIGPGANLHLDRKTNERFSLRALPAGEARRNEKLPSCSFFCEMAEQEYSA
jgi:3'-phosphoadenosine 5'-phosphosulfate sulfotransferase (PAPS reductase)/FAD synthetase